jgi:ubiquinone/menaquinone biosynthesis C-methylase UbiE
MEKGANEAGLRWSDLARLDTLAAVLDPNDRRGRKNRLIDHVHKAAFRSALGDFEGRRMLDFGCGTGRISAWLVEERARVVGVDITTEMLTVARRRTPNALFSLIDGQRLPFERGCLDAVLSAYVLQYYVRSGGAIVREIASCIREDGRLVAIEQVAHDDIGRGAPSETYRRLLLENGFRSVKAIPIRRSSSPVIRLARVIPLVGGRRATSWLVSREARLFRARRLTGGRYIDTCFIAVR